MRELEWYVVGGELLMFRIIAGLCCTLCHGAVHWKDFQDAATFSRATDALVGASDMKKQGMRFWLALKVGFSGENWGDVFFTLLEDEGMPCADFVLMKPCPSLAKFVNKPASYCDALDAVRMLFTVELGMTVEEACTYTLHSFRHVLITAGRQLGKPLSRDQQNEVGHWVINSTMPNLYDANACSMEIMTKNRIVSEFGGNKELAKVGEIPVDQRTERKKQKSQASSSSSRCQEVVMDVQDVNHPDHQTQSPGNVMKKTKLGFSAFSFQYVDPQGFHRLLQALYYHQTH
jgi:hypothetical protein